VLHKIDVRIIEAVEINQDVYLIMRYYTQVSVEPDVTWKNLIK